MLTIPNIITLLRIFLIPLFATTLIYRRFEWALYIFLLASTTDALDGLIARLKKQKTDLGAFLDPLADKLLLLTAFISLTILERLPKWLTIIVISRDIIVILGWISLYIHTGSRKVRPSILGKLSNIFQMLTIGVVLLSLNLSIPSEILTGLYVLTSSLAIVSCVHYVVREIKAL